MSDAKQVFGIKDSEQQQPPKEVIKVVGVGGGGGNALNNIIHSDVTDVDFIAVNTDMAALSLSEAPTKFILGKNLTKGRGAGADPERGYQAAKESTEELTQLLTGADMVFITAGMGGGTGTGASPVIAEIAKDLKSVVVGVVTIPFSWEGVRCIKQAQEGIKNLRDKVDALIIVENDRLLQVSDKSTTLTDAFKMADDVLRQAVVGVTGTIRRTALINVDFADVCSVMQNAGTAIMGIGEAKGEGRMVNAARQAMNGPLMTSPVSGARGVLYFIEMGPEVGLYEFNEATELIAASSAADANIIWGAAVDPEMGDGVRITLIATGFDDQVLASPQQTQQKKRPVSSTPVSSTVSAPAPNAHIQPHRSYASNNMRLDPVDVITEDKNSEDIFNSGGLPPSDTDIPTIIRRRPKK